MHVWEWNKTYFYTTNLFQYKGPEYNTSHPLLKTIHWHRQPVFSKICLKVFNRKHYQYNASASQRGLVFARKRGLLLSVITHSLLTPLSIQCMLIQLITFCQGLNYQHCQATFPFLIFILEVYIINI